MNGSLLTKDEYISILQQMTVLELLNAITWCLFIKDLIENDENVWLRHKQRVLSWCPKLSVFFTHYKTCYQVFTKVFMQDIESVIITYFKCYKDGILGKALLESAYSLQYPEYWNVIDEFVYDLTNYAMLFVVYIVTKPIFINMRKRTLHMLRHEFHITSSMSGGTLCHGHRYFKNGPYSGFHSLVYEVDMYALYNPRDLSFTTDFYELLGWEKGRYFEK